MPTFRFFPAALVALLAVTAAPELSLAKTAFTTQGYFENRMNADLDYPGYLKIKGDSGYYCVLDGKSSFRFHITGDSISTPFNGRNEIVWYPDSGDIQINGEEKGVAYHDRFKSIAAAGYPAACVEEEKAWYPAAVVRRLPALPGAGTNDLEKVDALGRVKATRREAAGISPAADATAPTPAFQIQR